jgi:hypothetical protein
MVLRFLQNYRYTTITNFKNTFTELEMHSLNWIFIFESQISDAYNNTGATNESKSFNCRSTGILIVKQQIILSWKSLLTDSNKLSHIVYKLMLRIHETRPLKFKWISYTKSILNSVFCHMYWVLMNRIQVETLLWIVNKILPWKYYLFVKPNFV